MQPGMETETRVSQPPDASAEVKMLRKKMLRLRYVSVLAFTWSRGYLKQLSLK